MEVYRMETSTAIMDTITTGDSVICSVCEVNQITREVIDNVTIPIIGNWTSISTSANTNTSEYLRELSDKQTLDFLPVILFIIVLMFLGTIGNLLVLYVHAFKFKPSSTRTFVLSLAFFDLLCCLIAMPGEILDIRFAYDYQSAVSCKLLRSATSFMAVASGITLMAVSFDRYSRICRPLKRQIGARKAAIMVIFAVLASVIISWPLIVMSGLKTVETPTTNVTGFECSVADKFGKSKYPLIYTICLFLVFMTAFVTMIIAYALIGRVVMRQGSFRKSMIGNRNRNRTISSTLSESDRRVRKISTTSTNDVAMEDNHCSGEHESEYSITSISPGKRTGITRKPSVIFSNWVQKTPDEIRTRKTTMMLFLISLIFLLSFLPHLILKALQSLNKGFLDDASLAARIFYNIFVRSFFINSVSNAFIYGFCSPRFRKEVKNICKSLARKRSFSLNSNSFNYM